MRLRQAILGVASALLLTACGSSGQYYEKSPRQIAAALKLAYLPTHILGSSVKGSRVTQPEDGTVIVALLDDKGSELMRFVTTITPDGTGSRVSTAVAAPEGKNKERAEAAMKKNGLAMGLMESVAKEHVAAAIEGRPFDMMFANPVGKGMAAAMPGMSEHMNAANEAAAEMAKYEQQADFEEKYGEDWGQSAGSGEDGWGGSE